MNFIIDAKNVVLENRVYTIFGYQIRKDKKYAEAVYNYHGALVNVEDDGIRERLMLKLEHKI